MIYFCCDERRRDAVREHPTLNGIDFLEVFDDHSLPFAERQRRLLVHFIKDLAADLTAKNFVVEGGERIRDIKVVSVTPALSSPPAGSPPQASPPGAGKVLAVEVTEAGDFSTYTLRLVQNEKSSQPPEGFDPVLSEIDFSFKVTCDSEFDCKRERVCPEVPATAPEIDYLAKDYASFRQLMLDRMAALMPEWRETSPADLGVALVELLAYVGDYLSYQQDAVATESYLGTARRRVSIRRLARLIDYPMHNGRNARAWIHVTAGEGVSGVDLTRGEGRRTTRLLTRLDGPALMAHGSKEYEAALATRPQVFELMHPITLYEQHNRMEFYTWGARECCLPKGATRATLRESFPNLKPGDVLIFQEERGPETGEASDADPTHRAAVRLTRVTPSSDPLGGQFEDPQTTDETPVTEIEWADEDALPFALCVSSRRGTSFFEGVSVALGNVVLADHGMTFTDVPEGRPFDPSRDATSLEPAVVPSPNPALTPVAAGSGDRCKEQTVALTPQRYSPRLTESPLTHAAPFDEKSPPTSASAAVKLPPVDQVSIPMPRIHLSEPGVDGIWEARRDLMSSGPNRPEFVVEVETDGTAFLRFGDDRLGSRPAPGTRLLATYRIGNGAAGNIGRDTIAHIVTSDPAVLSGPSGPAILAVTNPLPAAGGIDAQTIEEVRQVAPSAMRTQERAVTADDYAEVARRCDAGIQRAAATFRWTGSWRTVFLTVDRVGGARVDDTFEGGLRRCLERYRMAGHDVEVDGPSYVSLEVEMVVCVKRNYFTPDVKAALLEVFSNRYLPDGRRGVFHPDNFTFGQPVYLSSLYAAAQAVQGIDSVEITKFQRQGVESAEAIEAGQLNLERLEIARLDNDPNFPERGVFNLIMRGGQ
jgi:hypothetical protein